MRVLTAMAAFLAVLLFAAPAQAAAGTIAVNGPAVFGQSVTFATSVSGKVPRGGWVAVQVGCVAGGRIVYATGGAPDAVFPLVSGTTAYPWDGSPAACQADLRVIDRKGIATLLARTEFTTT
jgi:hypothetical protein